MLSAAIENLKNHVNQNVILLIIEQTCNGAKDKTDFYAISPQDWLPLIFVPQSIVIFIIPGSPG